MQEIAHKLEELYKWKDTTTGLHKAQVKEHLTSKLNSIGNQITGLATSSGLLSIHLLDITNSYFVFSESGSWGAKDKAFHFYLQGKALNVFDEYDKEAENNLSRAVC